MLPDCIISFRSVIFYPVFSVLLLDDHKEFTWPEKHPTSTVVLLLSSHVMYQAIIVQHHRSTRLIFNKLESTENLVVGSFSSQRPFIEVKIQMCKT